MRLFPEHAGVHPKGTSKSAISAVAGRADGFILILNLRGNLWSLEAQEVTVSGCSDDAPIQKEVQLCQAKLCPALLTAKPGRAA